LVHLLATLLNDRPAAFAGPTHGVDVIPAVAPRRGGFRRVLGRRFLSAYFTALRRALLSIFLI
jgi:hypothetical protein